ncbi:uncharacterized protein BX664DRAFT_328614 [Halteromyces radiatus]|uniref:uncharacterized protein n=1 Tax=Halteromyces radiatus TaxID=101107 RepID=UPI00221F477A|nr:uncharacterized protein BX664DRAFT_328614 [Halteromyces radiatus]KAI8092968.1 hypothetical protein BX664DRAFT_328614 [Halteromyces radiatus]
MSTWSIDYASITSTATKSINPIGFEQSALQSRYGMKSARPKNQDHNDVEMKIKRAWDVATGPAKSIPMNAFMIYMSGNGVQIFSVMITVMLFITPIKAIMSLNQTFERFETKGSKQPGADLMISKLTFIGLHIITICLGIYKVNAMGLLPTTTSDWLAFLPHKHVLEYASI